MPAEVGKLRADEPNSCWAVDGPLYSIEANEPRRLDEICSPSRVYLGGLFRETATENGAIFVDPSDLAGGVYAAGFGLRAVGLGSVVWISRAASDASRLCRFRRDELAGLFWARQRRRRNGQHACRQSDYG